MMRLNRFGIGFVALLVTAAVLGFLFAWYARSQPHVTIRHAQSLTVLEGLPHPTYEQQRFEQQSTTQKTIELSSFKFYADPLPVTPGDLSTLRHLLGDGTELMAYTGEKRCGGFHPDYAVQWSLSGATYLTLICFGCGEVRVIAPDQTSSMYDIRSHGQPGQTSELFILLKKYRANRPPHDRFGPLGDRGSTSGKREHDRRPDWISGRAVQA